MSANSGLMETEAGGEQTQYESIKTVTNPHSKSGGQISSTETSVPNSSSDLPQTDPQATSGEEKASNMRYGQTITETGGVSGFTAPSHTSGQANQEGGYGSKVDDTEGGAARQESLEQGEEAKNTRAEQGYGQGKDVRRDIGA